MRFANYLVASELNDYKPWILSTQALAVFCLTIWVLRLLLPGITLASASIDGYDLMDKINSERTQRFIPSLATNQKLITAATAKAQDMLKRSFFAHVDPDGNYVWPRIETAGFTPYTTLGENLAMDFTSTDAVVSAWMNSPTHRANIVNEKFEDQGLASIAGNFEPGHDTIMITSLFGTLYKPAKTTPPAKTPSPTPPPPVAKTPPPIQKPAPKPAPAKNPTPGSPTSSPQPLTSELEIYKDIKLDSVFLSGHTLVNVDIVIKGNPTLVTAKLKTQSISLIAGKATGQYIGSFTFDPGEDLSKETLNIEARDKNNTKVGADFPVNVKSKSVSGDQKANIPIPVSNEAQVIKILRIVFGIFALIYMGFLAVDAIIIHRAKLKTPGIHSSTHTLLFLLIAVITLFTNWA